jgi:hypothetical protein
MWTFDPAAPESRAAIEFLKSYGAPEPMLVQHPKPIIDILSVVPAAVDNLLLAQLYDLQEKYTEDAISAYANAVSNWVLNVAQQPWLPIPAVPELPSLISTHGRAAISNLSDRCTARSGLPLARAAAAAKGKRGGRRPQPIRTLSTCSCGAVG